MQSCPICGAKSFVFFNFVSQSSHHWHCWNCDLPLTFSRQKGRDGLFVLFITTALLYAAIRTFALPAHSMLVIGVPLIVCFDYMRYRGYNYVTLDFNRLA